MLCLDGEIGDGNVEYTPTRKVPMRTLRLENMVRILGPKVM